MTRSHLVWLATFLAVAVGFSLAMSACGVEALDLNGHPCPCGAGFTCDTTRNLCVTPDQIVVEAGVVEAGADPCLGDSCACATTADCKDNPPYTACVGTKCVQCTSTGPDTCPPLSYCLANQCATGCKTDAECASLTAAAPFCNTDRHQCVVCKTDAECTGGLKCSPAGACVAACTGTCANGLQCCNGLCLDTTSDPLNCNACGAACGGTSPACCAGACVDLLTSTTNCSKCGLSCSTVNGNPSCQGGSCKWSCAPGFSHCATGNSNTGCETDTSSNVSKCGSCYRNCNNSVSHATGVACVASACTYATCIAPNMDCDNNKANGCECISTTCGANGQVCCAGNVCNAGTDCEPAPAGDGKCHS